MPKTPYSHKDIAKKLREKFKGFDIYPSDNGCVVIHTNDRYCYSEFAKPIVIVVLDDCFHIRFSTTKAGKIHSEKNLINFLDAIL